MPTVLNNVSTGLSPIAKQIYETPALQSAIALNTGVMAVVNENVEVILYKEKINGEKIILARKTIIFSALDIYSPQLEKLVLLAGEKLFGRAMASSSAVVRASGFFGVPAYFDPLTSSTSVAAHISFSVAERSV
ncbi:MAG: hypothetical protein AB1861_04975 [Cyanobacteriota bacterium]